MCVGTWWEIVAPFFVDMGRYDREHREKWKEEKHENLYIDRDNAAITYQQEVEFFWELILLDPRLWNLSLDGKTIHIAKTTSKGQTG